MTQDFRSFRAEMTEEVCLEAMMAGRFGGIVLACPACGRKGRFLPAVKTRGYSCESCRHMLFPCTGTPLERARTPLPAWFFGVLTHETAGGRRVAGRLEKEADMPREAAQRMAADIAAAEKGSDEWLRLVKAALAARGKIDASAATLAPAPQAPSIASAGSAPHGTQTRLRAGEPERAPAPAPRRDRSQLANQLIVGGAVAFAVAIAVGLGVALMPEEEAETQVASAEDVPVLAAAQRRPRLVLSAVEDDLAEVRDATEALLKSDPSLGQVVEGDGAEDPGIAAPDIPGLPNVILVPKAPKAGTPQKGPRPTGPTGPGFAASGDPNQVLAFGPIKIRRHLVDTIVRASRLVGADPSLMMAVADKESSFATEVKAKTSSATGLYQFIESTWLGVVREFGPRHGLQREAAMIVRGQRGLTIEDEAERQRVLELRREPYISAVLAAEMLKRDALRLQKALGRPLTGGEVYLIHFLGPDGAQTFINKLEESPDFAAAELLPRPAEANKPIFYGTSGGETKTLSLAEVHKKFDEMIRVRLDRYRDVKKIGVAQPAPKR